MKWFKKRANLLNKTNQLLNTFIMPAKLAPIYQALVNNFNQTTNIQINKIFITGAKGSGKSALIKHLISDLNLPTLVGQGDDLKRFEQAFSDFNQPKHLLIIDQVDWQGKIKKRIKSYLDALDEQAILIVVGSCKKVQSSPNDDVEIAFDYVINLNWYYQTSDLVNLIDQAKTKQLIGEVDYSLLKKIVNDPNLDQPVSMWEVIKALKQVSLFTNAKESTSSIYRDLLMKKLETDRWKVLDRHLEYTMVSYGSDQNYYSKSEQDLIYGYDDDEEDN